jgi:hypothetical protein
VRRNFSSTCWAPSPSMNTLRPARSGVSGALGWGDRCRGFERARSNSRWRSAMVTSRCPGVTEEISLSFLRARQASGLLV